MSANLRKRKLIVKQRSLGMVRQIFLCSDAIEIDLLETYDVHIRRTFFTDVEMITLNRRRSRVAVILCGLVTLGCMGLILQVASQIEPSKGLDYRALLMGSAIFATPCLLLLAYFLMPYAHVTVFGRRDMVVMSWHLRHAHARRVFAELVQVVRAQQHAVTTAPADSPLQVREQAQEQVQIQVQDQAHPGDSGQPHGQGTVQAAEPPV